MDDDVRRQLSKRLQVVTEGQLDEMTLLHSRCADMPFEELLGGRRDEGRYLSLPFHGRQRRTYTFVGRGSTHPGGPRQGLPACHCDLRRRLTAAEIRTA